MSSFESRGNCGCQLVSSSSFVAYMLVYSTRCYSKSKMSRGPLSNQSGLPALVSLSLSLWANRSSTRRFTCATKCWSGATWRNKKWAAKWLKWPSLRFITVPITPPARTCCGFSFGWSRSRRCISTFRQAVVMDCCFSRLKSSCSVLVHCSFCLARGRRIAALTAPGGIFFVEISCSAGMIV